MSWFYKFYCRDKKRSAKNFSFFEMHHFYTGFAVWLIAFYLLFQDYNGFMTWLGFIMGLWLMLDDWFQHYTQGKQIEENIDKYNEAFYTCHTFWNWFPYWLLRLLGLYK